MILSITTNTSLPLSQKILESTDCQVLESYTQDKRQEMIEAIYDSVAKEQ